MRLQRQFARFGLKEVSPNPDDVAKIEAAKPLVVRLPEAVAARIDLETAATVVKLKERGFAERTDRHYTTRK